MRVEPLQGKALDALRHSTASINAYEGSVRSGKTVTTLIDWMRYCIRAPYQPGDPRYNPAAGVEGNRPPEGPLLIGGKTQRTIENNLINPMVEMLGEDRCRLNRGTGTLDLLGRTVYVIGGNNESARTKIQGLTLAGALLDEASTVPESFFNMLYSRLSVEGAQLWLTANPEGPAHWLKKKWLDRARLWIDLQGRHHVKADFDPERDPDVHRFTFGIDDNPNLPPAYVQRLKASYTGLWYRRYIEAAWVASEGAVYPMWDPARHVASPASFPVMERILTMGIDYGDTHATRGYLVGLGPDTRPGHAGEHRLYVLGEWAPPSLTMAQLTGHLRDWLASQPHGWGNPEWLAYDHAAATLKHQLFYDGWTNVRPAHKSVLDGIRTTAALLASGKLVIADTCTHLIERLPMYTWDDKATEKGMDKPVKVDDDEADALRYSTFTSRHDWRPFIPLTEHASETDDDPDAA